MGQAIRVKSKPRRAICDVWETLSDKGSESKGKNYSQIGKELNLSRIPLRSYARMSVPPNQGRQGTHRKIAPFLSYLKQRWEAGSQNVKHLLEEIRTLPTLTVFEWTRQ
ncbi:hypothetical protein D2Q93_13270 [Alicyclobacillaceae bacterium I2511]|nr:hypothetical protein D2Q93_13270 [Alicyclobacillaceae bacterium I2511]